MATKKCIACGRRPSESVDDRGIPPLCRSCWDCIGKQIDVGTNVVCTADESCSGTVERLEDGGTLAIVRTADGQDAWIPIVELVRVIG